MESNEKKDCRCDKTACGCAANVVERCSCGTTCQCVGSCRCGDGCRCKAK